MTQCQAQDKGSEKKGPTKIHNRIFPSDPFACNIPSPPQPVASWHPKH